MIPDPGCQLQRSQARGLAGYVRRDDELVGLVASRNARRPRSTVGGEPTNQ